MAESSQAHRMAASPRSAGIALAGVKLLHTAVWMFFVSCILSIPVAGWLGRFYLAAWLSAFVLVECAVIAVNRGRCPLTDMAARFTSERQSNFDIYLPLWLAEHNKLVFGTLFAFVECFVLGRWVATAL